MIIGIGTDICDISRIEKSLDRFGQTFIRHILSEEETPFLPAGKRAAAFLAGRWAAKEACVKAFGTGFAGGIGPQSISLLADASGAPHLTLSGPAKQKAGELGVTRMHVSISHDAGFAVAFVVLEADAAVNKN